LEIHCSSTKDHLNPVSEAMTTFLARAEEIEQAYSDKGRRTGCDPCWFDPGTCIAFTISNATGTLDRRHMRHGVLLLAGLGQPQVGVPFLP